MIPLECIYFSLSVAICKLTSKRKWQRIQIKLKICTHPTEHKDLDLALNHTGKNFFILRVFSRDWICIPSVLSHHAEIWSWEGLWWRGFVCLLLYLQITVSVHLYSGASGGLGMEDLAEFGVSARVDQGSLHGTVRCCW